MFCGVQVAVKRLLPSLCPSTPSIFDAEVDPVGAIRRSFETVGATRRSFEALESERAHSSLLSSPSAVALNGHMHVPQAGVLAGPQAGTPAQPGRLSRQLQTRVSSWLEYLLNASGLRQRMLRQQVGQARLSFCVCGCSSTWLEFLISAVHVAVPWAAVPAQSCWHQHVPQQQVEDLHM